MGIRLTAGRGDLKQLGVAGGTATGATGASTLNAASGVITTEELTTGEGAAYTHTLTNSYIAAGDIVLASVTTAGTGTPVLTTVTPDDGECVFVIKNDHASTDFDDPLVISFLVVKQT